MFGPADRQLGRERSNLRGHRYYASCRSVRGGEVNHLTLSRKAVTESKESATLDSKFGSCLVALPRSHSATVWRSTKSRDKPLGPPITIRLARATTHRRLAITILLPVYAVLAP